MVGAGGLRGRRRVQPIFAPENEVYLSLKPHRCLRAIRLSGDPFYDAGSGGADADSSDDDDSYWFETASPRRPKIIQTVDQNPRKKRIFHKFEAQPERKIPSAAAGSTPTSSGNRLSRKTIELTPDEDDDDDEEVVSLNLGGGAADKIEEKVAVVGPALENQTNLILNITADSTSKPRVTTSPDPEKDDDVDGEDDQRNCHTEEGSVVPGNLGGVANVGFESEEEKVVCLDDVVVEIDAGYSRVRDVEAAGPKSPVPSPRPDLPSPLVEKPQRPLLFFIHGIGGSADSWSDQLRYFGGSGFECVAVDLLGHGFSSAPDKEGSYTFQKLLGDVVTIFDHFVSVSVNDNQLRSNRNCVVIGHSYGCAIGAAVAKLRPDNVKVLVMIGCGGPTPLAPPLPDPVAGCCWCLVPFLYKAKSISRPTLGAKAKSRGFSTAAGSVAYRRQKSEFFRTGLLHIPPYVIRHLINGQNWPEGDAGFYRRLTCPTLLVYGLKDSFVSLVEMCEMERTMPKAYLELVPLAGHSVMQDQPQTFNAMMKKFVHKYTLLNDST